METKMSNKDQMFDSPLNDSESDDDVDPPGSIARLPQSIRSSTRRLREGWRGSNEKPSIHHLPFSTVYTVIIIIS